MKPDEIKTVRGSLLLTQEEFAQKLGVTKLTISYWEKGLRHPSSLAVKAILMLKEIEKRGADKTQLVQKAFDKLNKAHFEGALIGYRIELSRRLKRYLARAYPRKKLIRISLHYLEKRDWQNLEDTQARDAPLLSLPEGIPCGSIFKVQNHFEKDQRKLISICSLSEYL